MDDANVEIKIKQEQTEEEENKHEAGTVKTELKAKTEGDKSEEKQKEVLYFQCCLCSLREAYDYFGMNPPYTYKYLLMEDSYIIEDPFMPPKTGQFIVLGAVCCKCKKGVCKDTDCSIYFDGTYCMRCAQGHIGTFPRALQEKINKVISK